MYQIQHRISLSAPYLFTFNIETQFFPKKKWKKHTQTMEMWLLRSGSPRWPPPRRGPVFSMEKSRVVKPIDFWENHRTSENQWIGLRENLQETMVFTIK